MRTLLLPLSLALAVSSAGFAGRAHAATVVYFSDAAAFEAAVGPAVVEDFSDTSLVDGLALLDGNVMRIANGKLLDTAVANRRTTLDVSGFAGSVRAFGFDYDLAPGGVGPGLAVTVNFVDGTSMILQSAGPSPSAGFYGFRTDQAIASVSLSLAGSGADSFLLDDLRIAAASGAPEPAAWALLIAGFGLAGSMLRGRRFNHAPSV